MQIEANLEANKQNNATSIAFTCTLDANLNNLMLNFAILLVFWNFMDNNKEADKQKQLLPHPSQALKC
jgi:hypothetical protein